MNSRRLVSSKSSISILRWFLFLIFALCIYYIVSLLPKPDWICGVNQNLQGNQYYLPDVSETQTTNKEEAHILEADFIDFNVHKLLQQYPLYFFHNDSNSSTNNNETKHGYIPNATPLVKVFRLRNFNFENFSRTWVNEISEHDKHITLVNQTWTFSQLASFQKLPDCVRLRVPIGATPTKICVHYSKDDNFISNRLRDFGTWEQELLVQIEQFFRDNPRTQLVDLGCNVGVFTLFAASMGVPSLAVDILPANLALIQLSIAIADEYLRHTQEEDDIYHILNSVGYKSKHRPKYSHLISTLHNAVYSKRSQMYVYLKDDPNLGGTEVKEVNTLQSTQNKSLLYVNAVCLDDLLSFVLANRSVFLKMDLEGSESDVLLCANKFFMYMDVRVILMEVLFQRYSQQGRAMALFLFQHNFIPSEDIQGKKLLNPDVKFMYTWPENIFWIKAR